MEHAGGGERSERSERSKRSERSEQRAASSESPRGKRDRPTRAGASASAGGVDPGQRRAAGGRGRRTDGDAGPDHRQTTWQMRTRYAAPPQILIGV